MFIMTNVDISQDLIQVYDTKDNTNDVVRLSVLSGQILQKKIRVYGVSSLSSRRLSDAIPLVPYGICISYTEAKEAIASHYEKLGYARKDARAKAGLA